MNKRRLFRVEFVEQDELKGFKCKWRIYNVEVSIAIVMILVWEKIELDSSLFPVGFELSLLKYFGFNEIIQ